MQRIERMRKVNEFVDMLKAKMRADIRKSLNDNPDDYKELLKNLLI
jgi:hypothetical protein